MTLMKRCTHLIRVAMVCLPTLLLAQSNPTNSGNPDQGAPLQDHSNSSSMNSGARHDNAQGTQKVSASDQKFMREAAQGGLAEVELGKLATEKASSEDVKKFGQRMVDDHSKANDELKSLASSKGVDLPDQVSSKDKAKEEKLSQLSGADFDRAYMENMLKDHKKDVADFEKESTNGQENDVKQFASKTLPTLKEHLQQAQQIAPSGKTAANRAASNANPSR